MSGAIINLVYGVPLSNEAYKLIQTWCQTGKTFDNHLFDIAPASRVQHPLETIFGFKKLYTSTGRPNYYLGIFIKSVPEGKTIPRIEVTDALSNSQRESVWNQFDNLPDDLTHILDSPDHYFIWSNS